MNSVHRKDLFWLMLEVWSVCVCKIVLCEFSLGVGWLWMALAGNHQIVPKQMFSNSNNQRNWIHYIRNTCFHSCLGRCSYLCVVVQNSCPSNVNGGSDTTCNQHPNNNITKQPICPHGCIELVWSCSGSSIHVLCFWGKSRQWGWAKPSQWQTKTKMSQQQIKYAETQWCNLG